MTKIKSREYFYDDKIAEICSANRGRTDERTIHNHSFGENNNHIRDRQQTHIFAVEHGSNNDIIPNEFKSCGGG